jgi:hypothetical protein
MEIIASFAMGADTDIGTSPLTNLGSIRNALLD